MSGPGIKANRKWSNRRWQENTEELYKKELHDPDNHDGVITHLEPDILEREDKWALGSITKNKASVQFSSVQLLSRVRLFLTP